MPRMLLAVIGMMTVLSLAAAPAAVAGDETLWLDSYDLDNDGNAGPISTQMALTPGKTYVAEVRGTWNAWPHADWANPGACGNPEPAPLFPSPGTTNGTVGLDSEMMFAGTAGSFACRDGRTVPRLLTHFEIDTGAGFVDPTPVGGNPAVPSAAHSYSYALSGAGTTASFSFRLLDWPHTDNYGRFRIVVSPLSPNALCRLTSRLTQSSARYAALPPAHRRFVDALSSAACAQLDQFVGGLKPAKRAALLNAYKHGVAGLARAGWLTAAQASDLTALADQL